MTGRDQLIEKGYYVEKAVLSPPDIDISKNRLREVARHIDYYQDKRDCDGKTARECGRVPQAVR